MTYSIATYDPQNGEWGVGVQTSFLGVGALVPWVKPGVGAVATQAMTNATYGKKVFRLLEEGFDVRSVVEQLIKEDDSGESRQVGIVDARGRTAVYTGSDCYSWAGHYQGENFSCQGNMLMGEMVIEKMAVAYEKAEGDLAQKIITALKAAQKAGGDRRGRQSAALLIKKKDREFLGFNDTYIDLRVDDHQTPIRELQRIVQLHRVEYALNHRDKFYEFKGETRERLKIMLREIGFMQKALASGVNLKTVVNDYCKENIPDEKIIFKNNLINGEVVLKIVDDYREKQYKKLK
ncbi:MAG: DUF1028 domain-containing protein [Halanaerobiales bacterium]